MNQRITEAMVERVVKRINEQTGNAKVGDYYHSCGKRFLIRMISDDRDAINQFCEDNPGVGVIDSKDDSRVIVADIEETP